MFEQGPVADFACALLVVTAPVSIVVARAMITPGGSPPRDHSRLEAERGSVLIPFRSLSAGYDVLDALGRRMVEWGVSPDAVTWGSLGLAFVASLLLASGLFGAASLLLLLGSVGDGLDGNVARGSGRATRAGAVLDACLDRYAEMSVFGAALWLAQDRPILAVVAGLAAFGSFMTSYVSAKAEGLGVSIPRGSMRRLERAVLLTVGAALSGLFAFLRPAYALVPFYAALAIIAIGANVSSARRLSALRAALQAADAPPAARVVPGKPAHHREAVAPAEART